MPSRAVGMASPRYQKRPWSDARHEKAAEYWTADRRDQARAKAAHFRQSRADGVGCWAEQCLPLSTAVPPPLDTWVIAYWRHMDNPRDSAPKFRMGGWWPTRLRARGWQAQFGSHRCYPHTSPMAWMWLLRPTDWMNPPKRPGATEGGDRE